MFSCNEEVKLWEELSSVVEEGFETLSVHLEFQGEYDQPIYTFKTSGKVVYVSKGIYESFGFVAGYHTALVEEE